MRVEAEDDEDEDEDDEDEDDEDEDEDDEDEDDEDEDEDPRRHLMVWVNGILQQPGIDYEETEEDGNPGFFFHSTILPTDGIQYLEVSRGPASIGTTGVVPAGTFISRYQPDERIRNRTPTPQPERRLTEPPPSSWERILRDDEVC